MRKLIAAGFLVGGLLAMAAPAIAQGNPGGFGDPLTLAASGVLIPFITAGGDASILEVASPVSGNPKVHMLFFDADCNRIGVSKGLAPTENGVKFLDIDRLPGIRGHNGLVAIAKASAAGDSLVPLDTGAPIHTRIYWGSASGKGQILEPITLITAESEIPSNTWNPLRTAVTFWAPAEGEGDIHTSIYLICPKSTIQSGDAGGVFAVNDGFPAIQPPFPSVFSTGAANGALLWRIYDLNENFITDAHTGCNCLDIISLSDPRFAGAFEGPEALVKYSGRSGTYTEIESGSPDSGTPEFPFTGYKRVQFSTSVADYFGRLSNGNRISIEGTLTGDTR